jgi:hypothetical protein
MDLLMNKQEKAMRALSAAGQGATFRILRHDGRGHAARKVFGLFDSAGSQIEGFETSATIVLRLLHTRRIEQGLRDEYFLPGTRYTSAG